MTLKPETLPKVLKTRESDKLTVLPHPKKYKTKERRGRIEKEYIFSHRNRSEGIKTSFPWREIMLGASGIKVIPLEGFSFPCSLWDWASGGSGGVNGSSCHGAAAEAAATGLRRRRRKGSFKEEERRRLFFSLSPPFTLISPSPRREGGEEREEAEEREKFLTEISFRGCGGEEEGKKKSRAPPAPSLPSLPLFFSLPHPPAHSPRCRRRRSRVGGTGICLLSRRRRRRASPRDPQAADALSFFLSLCPSFCLRPSRPPRPAASAFPVRQARPAGLPRSPSVYPGLSPDSGSRSPPPPSASPLPLAPSPSSSLSHSPHPLLLPRSSLCVCVCVSLRQRRHLSPANELRPSRQPETQASVAAAPGAATAAAAPAAAAAAATPAAAAAPAAASAAATAAAAASAAATAASAAASGAEQRRRAG